MTTGAGAEAVAFSDAVGVAGSACSLEHADVIALNAITPRAAAVRFVVLRARVPEK